MKTRSGTYGKTRETLPLEGGGKRVGVKDLTGVARRPRKHSTDTERHLWRYLRDRQIEGFKFRRQQAVGRYVVDFANFDKKVVVELDGGQHALDLGDKIPLTLTLSPRGRGEINFDNTNGGKRRRKMKRIKIPFLVTVLSLMVVSTAFAVDITDISAWTQPMGVGAGLPGMGDLLLSPLYDVRSIVDPNLLGAAGETPRIQYSLINLVNTDPVYGVIARLRFREWKRGDEVLSIDIPIACNAAWVAEVSLNSATEGATLRSPNRWISGPPTGWGEHFPSAVIGTGATDGLSFTISNISSDSATSTDAQKYARTLYGYFEVIAEELVECSMHQNGDWSRLATTAREVPDILMGEEYIIGPDLAISHKMNLWAYSDFAVRPEGIWQGAETGRPNLFDDVQCPPNGVGCFDQLEAIMSKRFVAFQFVNSEQTEENEQDRTPMSTSVVITFPTKHFHYDSSFHAGGVAGWAPFIGYHETSNDGGDGGEGMQALIYNREGVGIPVPCTPSIPPVCPQTVLPWEVNVVGISKGIEWDPFSRGFRDNILVSTGGLGRNCNEGWGLFDLSPGSIGGPVNRANRSQGKTNITFSLMEALFSGGARPGQYRGLPAIGVVMTEFYNDSRSMATMAIQPRGNQSQHLVKLQ